MHHVRFNKQILSRNIRRLLHHDAGPHRVRPVRRGGRGPGHRLPARALLRAPHPRPARGRLHLRPGAASLVSSKKYLLVPHKYFPLSRLVTTCPRSWRRACPRWWGPWPCAPSDAFTQVCHENMLSCHVMCCHVSCHVNILLLCRYSEAGP